MKKLVSIILIFMLTGCNYTIIIKPEGKKEVEITEKKKMLFPIRGTNEIIIGPYPCDTNWDKSFGINLLLDNTTGTNNLAIGMSALYENTTGTGMFIYHGENNPLNDSLCKADGHVFEIPLWLKNMWEEMPKGYCYRCGKLYIDNENTAALLLPCQEAIGMLNAELYLINFRYCLIYIF